MRCRVHNNFSDLAIKYGITLDQSAGSYISSDAVAVWSNTSYWNDVFGLGRDNNTGLNQTFSNSINTGSGDGTGQNGLCNILMSNPSSLDDGDYLMVGHDNAPLAEQTNELPAGLIGGKRLSREWYVQKVGDAGTIEMSFDITGLSLSGKADYKYKLLLDNDNDFSSGAIVINASSYTGTHVTFSGLFLVNDLYFTLVTETPGPIITGANGLPSVGGLVVGLATCADNDLEICIDAISPMGDTLDVSAVTILTGSGSTWSDPIPGDTCFTYEPAPGFSGPDLLEVVVCDNNTPPDCDTVILEVIVNAGSIVSAGPDAVTCQNTPY